MPSSRGSSRHRDQTGVSESPALAGRFFTAEPSGKPLRTLCLCKLLRILLSTVSITNSYLCFWLHLSLSPQLQAHHTADQYLQGLDRTVLSLISWFLLLLDIVRPSLHSVQFSHSVVSDSLGPHDRSTPGLPVHHQLPEFTQTHAHGVGDAIQPFHPLSSPSPPAPNPSQHQGLFQRVSSLHEVAEVLEFQLQHQSFQ